MADTLEPIDAVTEAVENITEAVTGKKIPATPEGIAVAYGSLVIMALLPIFFGALRSVKHQKQQKVRLEGTNSQLETVSLLGVMFAIICEAYANTYVATNGHVIIVFMDF